MACDEKKISKHSCRNRLSVALTKRALSGMLLSNLQRGRIVLSRPILNKRAKVVCYLDNEQKPSSFWNHRRNNSYDIITKSGLFQLLWCLAKPLILQRYQEMRT